MKLETLGSQPLLCSNRSLKYYIPALDSLRFLAFLLVFFHHINFYIKPSLEIIPTALKAHGWIGVDLFFVLSSYLIGRLILIEELHYAKFSCAKFFMRRILRIWPLYFLSATLGFLFFPLFETSAFSPKFNTPQYAAMLNNYLWPTLLFYLNYSIAFMRERWLGLTILWTVTAEEQFYIVVGAIAALSGRIERLRSRYIIRLVCLCLLPLIVASVCWITYAGDRSVNLYFHPLARVHGFALGLACALVERLFPRAWHSYGRGIIACCGVPLGLCLIYIALNSIPEIRANSAHAAWQYLALDGGFAAIVWGISCSKLLQRLLSLSILVWLGKISYGLYMYHGVSLFFASHLSLPPVLAALVALTLAIFISAISYYFFERPFLRLKDRFAPVAVRPI